MGMYLKFVVGVLNILILNQAVSSTSFRKAWTTRSRRQAGYVYDRPSVSFDLPSRSTPEPQTSSIPAVQPTQAPAITDRTQSQYMYYAYPVPSGGGDTVNIGFSSTGASTVSDASTAVPSGGGGYNYGTQSAGTSAQTSAGSSQPGYNYNTASTAGPTSATTSSGGGGYNSGTQGSIASGPTGYDYNSPVPSVRPISGAPTVTTGAPQYLPPTGGSVNIPSGSGVSVNTGELVNTPSGSGSTGSTSRPTQTTPSTPNASYLPPAPSPSPSPPIPFPSPSPSPSPSPTFLPSPQPSGYLPPVVSTPGLPAPNTVSTPASTYLPPVF